MTTQKELANNSKAERGCPEALEKLVKGIAGIIARQVLEQAKNGK